MTPERDSASFASFASFDEAFAWLAARTNYETMATQRYDERTYGLARVERLLDRAGRPDHALACAQVVGSKGKGTAAACLASILTASGRRTGLFTSPHLVDPRERIAVDGVPAADAAVAGALARLRGLVEAAGAEGEPLTFFEVHTAAALLAFGEAGCAAAVLEAGMGGRLDATTAARAVVKVLTSVSLDHVQHLGRTRRAVAREKAAAARPGVLFVSGVAPDTPEGRVVEETCARVGAPLLSLEREFRVRRARTALDVDTGRTRTTFRLELSGAPELELEIPLLGRHQAANAAAAAVAALRAPWPGGAPRPEHVREGLARVSLPARCQVLATRPLLLCDGAHTPASASRLAATLREVLPGRRVVAVVGMAADKDVAGTLRRLAPAVGRVVATTSGAARAAPPEAVAAAARAAGLLAETAQDLPAALEAARRHAGRDGAIVVTGSLYLCGACLDYHRRRPGAA